MNLDKFFYRLDASGNPVPCPRLHDWVQWKLLNDPLAIVAQEHIGESLVSTVFIGYDLSCSQEGLPIVWETRVFGGPLAGANDRCSGSREQAEAMHAKMVQQVRTAAKGAAN